MRWPDLKQGMPPHPALLSITYKEAQAQMGLPRPFWFQAHSESDFMDVSGKSFYICSQLGARMKKFAKQLEYSGLSVSEAADRIGASEDMVRAWIAGEKKPWKGVYSYLPSTLKPQPKKFKFIDLFAGIGGLRKGFEEIGGVCVFTSEWDKHSQLTYKANFPDDEHEIAGDITDFDISKIPSHDVLLAGFPCQPFSIAGVSKKNALNRPHGFACEAQGTLFFEVAKIIDAHRPAAFLLENVRNLKSHDKGKTFEVIKKVLTEDLGYQIDWRVIDAKGWVPQHRERIFIAGFRDPSTFRFSDMVVKSPEEGPRLATILHPEDGSERPELPYTVGNIGAVSPRYTLTPKLWAYLQNYSEKHRQKGNGFGFGLVGPAEVARTLSARYYKDGSEILIRQTTGTPRRLTPRECARLMGFDEPGSSDFKIPVSDTQAYRQFGNSVVVPVVKAVAAHMQTAINAAVEEKRLQAG